MFYDKYYFIRVFIAAVIVLCFKLKGKDNDKVTKRMRIWLLFAIMLMLPIKISEGYMIFLNPAVFFGTIAVLYEIYLKIYVKVRNKNYELEMYKDIDTLNREVKFKYNPSIVGYLMNQELDLSNLSADILNLYAKKIIDIKKDATDNYTIVCGEKRKEYEGNLNSGDQYIVEKLLLIPGKFDFLKWKHKVINEYDSLSLSKTKEYMSNKKFYTIIIVMVILVTVISKVLFNSIEGGLIVSLLIALGFVLGYSVIYQNTDNKKLKLTSIGEEEIKKCIKLKRFMEEYTLLKDRTPEEICIYESYIPYAIALGVNKKYYGTIYDIFGKEELKDIIEDIDIIEYYNE